MRVSDAEYLCARADRPLRREARRDLAVHHRLGEIPTCLTVQAVIGYQRADDPRRHDLVNVKWVTPLGVETASMA
ncbi:hypothetical protein SAMN05660209_04564 [Geodermatophilus africanus]|uniref:Uncharacterized protein n=1 Tax=Geodermatophilus africanus TaxID=1137993 RepID=A0A1H3Q1V7_9ACTN|nr:hypothetical protein SAMN05660209_04564 [Geodermatophilus africanus]